ncbi:GntR family transcriptional regulator [Streptomyces sp. ODS28]|uniref:GntR family transcriptional regulator n=1 Tax=Streptomyces sp. ODS28 TaxID=3136688 RepID=UPI0031EF8309
MHSEPAAPAAPVVPPAPEPPAAASGRKMPRRHSVRGQVLEALREALLSGELAPGEVHSAPALAERFGVSPTPVREAMQQLASEGAVETVPNRGFRVAEFSARDLAELSEIRMLLEIPTVLRAAHSAPRERWEELRPLAEETLTAATGGDRVAYAAADRAFHRAVLEVTGNRRLVEIVDDVQRRVQRRPAPVPGSRSAAALLGEASEHVALLDALTSRDVVTAERLMRDHATL